MCVCAHVYFHVHVHVYIYVSAQKRRRSQRNVGQRKRYVDDLTLSISDDELLEDVMSARPRTKKEYKVHVHVRVVHVHACHVHVYVHLYVCACMQSYYMCTCTVHWCIRPKVYLQSRELFVLRTYLYTVCVHVHVYM